jgi:hypothetical protein
VFFTLIRFAFSQTFTISSKSLVSPYIDEWIENNNFKIVNHSFNGPVKIFTKIFDNNNRLVLGTDTPYFKDAYDTLASNDTLNASSIFPVHRVYLDSPYSDLYDSLHYIIRSKYFKYKIICKKREITKAPDCSEAFVLLVGMTGLSPITLTDYLR